MKNINNDLFHCKVIFYKIINYKVSVCDDGIQDFHSRLNLLTLFFIDGASFIDYNDSKWEIFYLLFIFIFY